METPISKASDLLKEIVSEVIVDGEHKEAWDWMPYNESQEVSIVLTWVLENAEFAYQLLHNAMESDKE